MACTTEVICMGICTYLIPVIISLQWKSISLQWKSIANTECIEQHLYVYTPSVKDYIEIPNRVEPGNSSGILRTGSGCHHGYYWTIGSGAIIIVKKFPVTHRPTRLEAAVSRSTKRLLPGFSLLKLSGEQLILKKRCFVDAKEQIGAHRYHIRNCWTR